MYKGIKQVTALVLALVLLPGFCSLAESALNLVKEEYQDSHVSYPQLSGMNNAFVQDTVNAAIKSRVEPFLNSLMVIKSGTVGELKADTQVQIFKHESGQDVLSGVLIAEGRMPSGRIGYHAVPMMFSLSDGHEITADEVFTDKEAARAYIENDLDIALVEDLSNYLDISSLTPFPLERFILTETGISFFYPENSLVWLSGRAASVTYLYHEIKPLLNLNPGSLMAGLNLDALLNVSPDTAERVEQAVISGTLPGLDVRLGEPIASAIDRNKLQYDPEGFPTGEKYQLEDDRYRGAKVIANEAGLVTALLSTRMNLFGLITGQTNRAGAEAALGKALMSMPMAGDMAALYGLPEGTLAVYGYEKRDLKLYFDSADVLYTVWLEDRP